MLYLLFLILKKMFTVFTWSLFERMLPKSFLRIVCPLRSSCNKNLLCKNTVFSSSAFLRQVSSVDFICILFYIKKFLFYKIQSKTDSFYRKYFDDRGDIGLLSLTDIMWSLLGKSSILSNLVFLILYVTTLQESFSLLTLFRNMDSLAQLVNKN